MIPAALQTKLGPLPAWAWGLLLGAGVLGYAYLHRTPASTDQADAGAGDGTGDTTGTSSDVQPLDSTAPLDFAGPTSGYANATPDVPQSLRIDPAQWARLQRELKQLRERERRDHQRAPKHKHHKGTPQHHRQAQPSAQRPRQTGVTVNSGSGGQ